jgi:hypothetical protein
VSFIAFISSSLTFCLDRVSVGVTDGVTVGHPCCVVHNCKVPLQKRYHKYCHVHEKLRLICQVEGCTRPTSSGKQTCDIAEHQALEVRKHKENKAMFKLQKRLHKLKIQPGSEVAEVDDNVIDSVGHHTKSIKKGRKKDEPKATLSRRWTHNEQLFVWCCGIIASRATFYGSEAISSVKVSIYCFNFALC